MTGMISDALPTQRVVRAFIDNYDALFKVRLTHLMWRALTRDSPRWKRRASSAHLPSRPRSPQRRMSLLRILNLYQL